MARKSSRSARKSDPSLFDLPDTFDPSPRVLKIDRSLVAGADGPTTQAAAADTARDAVLSGLLRAGLPSSDPCQIVFTRGSFHGG